MRIEEKSISEFKNSKQIQNSNDQDNNKVHRGEFLTEILQNSCFLDRITGFTES